MARSCDFSHGTRPADPGLLTVPEGAIGTFLVKVFGGSALQADAVSFGALADFANATCVLKADKPMNLAAGHWLFRVTGNGVYEFQAALAASTAMAAPGCTP